MTLFCDCFSACFSICHQDVPGKSREPAIKWVT